MFVKQIFARPADRLTSSDCILHTASPACTLDTLPPRRAAPYLLDLMLGYGCHWGRSSPNPTTTTTMPAGLCRADSASPRDPCPQHVIKASAEQLDSCTASEIFVPITSSLFLAGTFRAAQFCFGSWW